MGGSESTHSNSKAAGSDDQDLAQMTKKEKEDQVVETLKVVGTVAAVAVGVALVGWGLPKLVDALGQNGKKKKMMKAPGRDFLIFRDDFEHDPSAYFHSLRN
ncbi:hypothetical protein Vadar_030400 [Vaccinium darrowii]|uniref:Uncharacterized protein n=3 Tax=Vaccinium darrowii TaxID=229202 RepID=A0ACB7XIB3_9ERIC|nr:hypothetical protein Vadar_017948 [Vaccinium darrowii]KAH7841275.1 hypothetical protein Vadar_027810 [Vaccinium darrowii]KAH7841482.1 hypothetical protein Vadar_030400 [Vaccinium darrowii]